MYRLQIKMGSEQMELMGGGDGDGGGAATQSAQSHVLVFPFAVQGHMTPMIEFAKRLVSKGLKVTVVTTTAARKFVQPSTCRLFDIQQISDGTEHIHGPETIDQSTQRFKKTASQTLGNLIINIKDKNKNEHSKLKFLVYHSAMPWALDIARQHGIDGAPFFTNCSAVIAIYENFRQGVFKIPSLEDDRTSATILIPSMPPLAFTDLPSFLRDVDSYPAYLDLTLSQFSNIKTLKWLFICSFYKLDEEVVKWMESQNWPVKTIGPTIPSNLLDKRTVEAEGYTEYGLSLFKPDVENCFKWLNSKETGSVVYVSFGSMANLKKEQIEELAWGLRDMNHSFMWAVRETEMVKLPINYLEEISDKGLVVSWCQQLQVLAHKAVRCFVTHCGWNSVLEALSFGVPMVGMPHWADQATNAKFVSDVWKVGVRMRINDRGIATKEEIAMCIKQVLEGEKGIEMTKASLRWRELAKEAVDQGGSSDKNIEEFAAKLSLIN